MVYTLLDGGLGNQLFQFALAFRLARELAQEVGMDTALLNRRREGITPRVLGLKESESVRVLSWDPYGFRVVNRYARVLYRHIRMRFDKDLCLIMERERHSVDWMLRQGHSRNLYLYGYWQDAAYFEPVRDPLVEAIRAFYQPDAKTLDLGNRMASVNSLSLHVRRGDYLRPEVAEYVHLLDAAYYQRALRLVPHVDKIYVFSDDPRWCVEHLSWNESMELVSGEGQDSPWRDLYLMSRCRHHLIANSTYSWWGAYLGVAEGITVAPVHWFKDSRLRVGHPKHWITCA